MTAGAEERVIVSVRNLAKHFSAASWRDRMSWRRSKRVVRAVDDISFDVMRGETLALVGESGCGKSTIGRLLVGLDSPTNGSIAWTADAPQAGDGTPPRRRVQMIFQDPYGSLNPRWRIRSSIAEAIKASTDQSEIQRRIGAALIQVGLLPADGEKYPHQFSGGQRQRISIARALSSGPEFIVCDEPTSGLDVSVQAQILNLMRDLQDELRLTYVFISHNLAVVHHMADRIGVMYLGRLVEFGEATTVLNLPQHPYTKMLIDSIPDVELTGVARRAVQGEVPDPMDPPEGCAFHPRCPWANERCRIERPELGVTREGPKVACHAVEEARIAQRPTSVPL